MPVLTQFHRADDEQFAHVRNAVARDRIGFAPERNLGFIDLGDALEHRPVRIDHRPPELLEKQPGGLVAAQAELCLGLLGRQSVGVAGEQADRLEPGAERQVAAVHHRPGGDRGLSAALGTLPRKPLATQLPALPPVALRADEAFGPSVGEHVASARGIVREFPVKCRQRHRLVVFPPAGH